MDEQTYHLDYSPGNGSADALSDEWDHCAVVENDGRSLTRTGFDPRDVSDDKVVERNGETLPYWEWLNQLNDGRYGGDASDRTSQQKRVRRADARRDARTFGSQLGMKTFQIDRVCYIIDRLDDLHFGTIPVEGVVLALLSLVANESGWRIREKPRERVTNGTVTKNVPVFTRMCVDCRVSPSAIRHVREELREVI